MKLWITKYALTQGVYETEVEACSGFADMYKGMGQYSQFYHRKDYEFTKAEADAKAIDMAKKKKIGLLKSIAKLEKRYGV